MATSGAAIQRAGAVLILLFLTACNHVPDPRDLPLDAIHRGLAMDAVSRLGEALNRGACQSIYDDASEVFRQLEPLAAWESECERIRAALGLWESFSTRAAFATGPSTVLVDGTAVFAKGRRRLDTTWSLEHGSARLFSLYLEGAGGRPTMVPAPWPRPKPRLTDPPPKRQVVAV
ncbi:MAG: hypothetical protein ABSF98_01910 [Bryobacteraceae bacterium]|jgi:hypothetical protein